MLATTIGMVEPVPSGGVEVDVQPGGHLRARRDQEDVAVGQVGRVLAAVEELHGAQCPSDGARPGHDHTAGESGGGLFRIAETGTAPLTRRHLSRARSALSPARTQSRSPRTPPAGRCTSRCVIVRRVGSASRGPGASCRRGSAVPASRRAQAAAGRPAGYSGTPLPRKLGIRPQATGARDRPARRVGLTALDPEGTATVHTRRGRCGVRRGAWRSARTWRAGAPAPRALQRRDRRRAGSGSAGPSAPRAGDRPGRGRRPRARAWPPGWSTSRSARSTPCGPGCAS